MQEYSNQQCPPPPAPNGCNNNGGSVFDNDRFGKSRGVCALLAIFLGGLGIQYFYLGRTTAGILAIVLTLVTCGFFNLIWLIQGILMLTMTAETFEMKYETSTSTLPIF